MLLGGFSLQAPLQEAQLGSPLLIAAQHRTSPGEKVEGLRLNKAVFWVILLLHDEVPPNQIGCISL